MHRNRSAVFVGGLVAAMATSVSVAGPTDGELGLKVGDQAPDAPVKTLDGEVVHLQDFYDNGVTVLIFYRGEWCPYCVKSLSGWAGRADEVESLGAQVIAISPETTANGQKTKDKTEVEFTLLSDYAYNAAKAFGVAFEVDDQTKQLYEGYNIDLAKANAGGTWTLPYPGTYVIDADGVIRYAWVQEDYRQRAEPDEVIAVVQELAGE